MGDDSKKQDIREEKQGVAIRRVANALHRLNEAVIGAVHAGVTVELMRASKYDTDDAWGDMMVPIIHKD